MLAGKWIERLPSETELASRLQVSRPTLRTALSRLADEGWIRARQGLGWQIVARPTRAATSRGPTTIALLGFVPLDQASPFALFLMDQLQHRLRDAGCEVEVHAGSKYFMQNHRRALTGLVKTSRADLWVLLGASTGIDECFQAHRLRFFCVGKPREGIRCPWLDWDQRAVFRHAAGVLLARGHRHFVCLLPRYMAFGYKEASEGFREGVKACFQSASVNARIVYHPGTVDGACRVIASIFAVAKPPTALLVASPRYALTVVTHLAYIGRRIPRDVSVIAVGHEPFLDNVFPSIAHYSTNREAFARKLCRMVLHCATAGSRSMPGATVMGRFQDGESLSSWQPR